MDWVCTYIGLVVIRFKWNAWNIYYILPQLNCDLPPQHILCTYHGNFSNAKLSNCRFIFLFLHFTSRADLCQCHNNNKVFSLAEAFSQSDVLEGGLGLQPATSWSAVVLSNPWAQAFPSSLAPPNLPEQTRRSVHLNKPAALFTLLLLYPIQVTFCSITTGDRKSTRLNSSHL